MFRRFAYREACTQTSQTLHVSAWISLCPTRAMNIQAPICKSPRIAAFLDIFGQNHEKLPASSSKRSAIRAEFPIPLSPRLAAQQLAGEPRNVSMFRASTSTIRLQTVYYDFYASKQRHHPRMPQNKPKKIGKLPPDSNPAFSVHLATNLLRNTRNLCPPLSTGKLKIQNKKSGSALPLCLSRSPPRTETQ